MGCGMEYILNYLISFGLKREKTFLRELCRLEYGVSVFCHKLSIQASEQGLDALAKVLEEQGNSELKHGIMLGGLVDGKSKLVVNSGGTGHWTPGQPLPCGGWQRGKRQSFDGLSQKYFGLRMLFNGRKAENYNWIDKLAFMHVLELGTGRFYSALSSHSLAPEPLKAIASKIKTDEQNHALQLFFWMEYFSDRKEFYIRKWSLKSKLAMPGLLVDLLLRLN